MKKESLFQNISWIFLFFLTLNNVLLGQDSTAFRLVQTIPIAAKQIFSDKLQQFYAIGNENSFIKFSPDGVEVARFKENILGTISSADLSDPFNILLYYHDFQIVIILDRNLTKINQYYLRSFDNVEPTAVGLSNDHNIWLFDQNDYKLKKIDYTGKVLFESISFPQLFGKQELVNFILERENTVFLNIPNLGIVLFDSFGQYLQTLDKKTEKSFQVIDSQLFYLKNHQLFSLHLQRSQQKNIVLPSSDAEQEERYFTIQKNKIWRLTATKIEIFVW